MKTWLQWLGAAALAAATGSAYPQAYPNHAVTLVVPFAAGGPTDVVARTLAASMGKTLGQSVIVENKLGAGGTIAANYVAKAAPDGYTIFIHHNGMATATALYRKLPYNPLTDFEYIGQVADVPMTMLARKDFPPDNLQDFIAYVRANKEKLNLANAGLGAVSHLCGMLFQQAVGVELTTVPFQGTGPAMTALLGGQGRHALRPDHADHPADQGAEGEVLRRHHTAPHRRASRRAHARRAGVEGLRGGGVARHLRAQGAPRARRSTRVNAALRPALKDPMVASKFAELGAPDRARRQADARGPARLAQVGDRQVGAGDPEGGDLRGLTAKKRARTPRRGRAL
jgi:tripartite-type tricarboxylate transporter receptor subunit TctC